MTEEEMHFILSQTGLYPASFDAPTENDWLVLERKFGCEFDADIKRFYVVLSRYSFTGEILNVATSKNSNGNDTILLCYEYELKFGKWDGSMIPFYAIGNGDYFCIKNSDVPASRVYYVFHEDARIELQAETFADWLRTLPKYL